MPVPSIEQETGTVILIAPSATPLILLSETGEAKKAAKIAAKTSKLVVLRYGHFTLILLF